MENIKLLFQLYLRPAFTMSEIIDKGSCFWAAVLVLLTSIAFYLTINTKLQESYGIPEFNYANYSRKIDRSAVDEEDEEEFYRAAWAAYQKELAAREKIPVVGDNLFRFFSFEPGRFYVPLLSLSVFYVPVTILLIVLFARPGSFGVVLQRDYGSLATCTLMAWAAAHLPFAIAGILLFSQTANPLIYLGLWLVSGLFFGVLMVFAVRTLFGADYAKAILTVCVSWLGFSLGIFIFRFVSPLLFSPFLLFWAFIYFGGYLSGEARGFGNAFRQRQNFKRYLQNATINPRDADAHVQLGLIYKQRRQTEKALEHFKKAVEIDKNEIDANYELGKIARENSELQKAIEHFSIVVEQNEKHSLNEIWREIGATYLNAKMLTEARRALEKFVERRPFDTEGLYYLGKTLKTQGETNKAREIFEQAIEAAKTSPDYRKYEVRNWSKLAQKEL
jgi:tetratricopeptide (TPR) repeat protein